MVVFKYGFERKWKNSEVALLDSCGELSKIFVPSAIVEANNEVKDVLSRGSKQALYFKTTPEMKAVITKYASENGSIQHFEKQFVPNSLKESTIRGWKNLYQTELEAQLKQNEKDLRFLRRKWADLCCWAASWIRKYKHICEIFTKLVVQLTRR